MRRVVALVVPSTWFEGFPMVVVEAYATGTPVIASRLGSLAEIVEDGVTGLLVAPGDATELARSVRWAVDHPEEMREMGVTARRRYEARFRGPSHLAALLDAYQTARVGAARAAHA
jgi:glycosyltransferase involved in cell wall biosynthesis